MKSSWIKPVFIIAALYDFVLGVFFLVMWKRVYAHFHVTLPNHDGYVQFAAMLVAIFGVGFWCVAKDPARNRDIITMGVLLKVAYCTVVLGHHFFGSIPNVWVPFAWCDLVFLVVFVMALRALPSRKME